MKEYNEEDFLMLSGIQHYVFCPRQWAMIHIEQQWAENYYTVDGEIMHENPHDKEFTEKRGNLIITRGMPVHSRTLGISGNCDVVEFHKDKHGVFLPEYGETYLPIPVEYKRGKPKEHDADALQLCAQAICLEEMFVCDIPRGYLYYGEPKKRQEISFEKELRDKVTECFSRMHELFQKQYTPKGKKTKHCQSCSLVNLCLPEIENAVSVKTYLKKNME
ncbi:MAG: CRISPR-associated protein Cas4 [Lachnospiraceae bacterium]